MPLRIGESGARITESSIAWAGRSPIDVHDTIARRFDELADCWKWASAKRGLGETSVHLAFDVERSGEVGGMPVPGDSKELATCVREQLAGVASLRTSPLATHAT